jgi:NADH-ubiquinone oxidoreductase chain 2
LSLNSLNLESIGSGIGIYSGFFQVTTISQLIEIFLFIVGGGILVAWPSNFVTIKSSLSYLSTEKYSTDYSLVVLFSSLGSSLLISSYDLISVYLSIELQSFGLYVLSTLYRDSESSTKAGLKYFLLGGLSSCIILLGTGIIYSYTGTTNLESLYIINSVIIDVNQQYIIQGISLGLSLIFIGFLFKIAAAPLHNWSPDVYDGTPTIVTTWLTIIPKIAILFILLELQIKLGNFGLLDLPTQLQIEGENLSSAVATQLVTPAGVSGGGFSPSGAWGSYPSIVSSYIKSGYLLGGVELKTIIVNNSGYLLKTLLLISATLSLIIGSLLGLAQIKIKRLLAYSTISHLGFILLALAVNTEQSIDSFIFYIIQYTITNLNIFLVILGLTYCLSTYYFPSLVTNTPYHPSCYKVTTTFSNPLEGWDERNKDISLISEFKGLFFSNPLLSISLAVSLFSMAGIPPLIGFFSKQLVLYSALQNGYYFISVLAIIVSVISCSYYLQIIKILLTPSNFVTAPHSANQLQLFADQPSSWFAPSCYEITTTHTAPAASASAATQQGATVASLPSFGPSKLLRGAGEIEGHYVWIKKNGILLTNTHSYLISTLTFTILLFFIKPSLILNSTQLLSLSLFYI